MTGIEARAPSATRCHVVFITAYNEYAVEAFEQGAVDYVLKPAERERLERHGRAARRSALGQQPSRPAVSC